MNAWKGTGVAMVTPFKEDGSIDFDVLHSLTDYLIQGGVDYLVVNGTTAENPVLNDNEKQAILNEVVKANDGRVPVVFGLGGNHTNQVLESLFQFDLSGVSALLSVTPYYNKPGQRGLYAHFGALAEVSPLPIMLYNVPSRTGIHLQTDTVLALAKKYPQCIGIKEASGDFRHITRLIKERPREDFAVISGDDALTLPLIASGCDGVISVIANALPKPFSAMVADALANNMAEAKETHLELFELMHLIFEEQSPGGVKALMQHLGICQAYMRLPLVPIEEGLKDRIVKAAKALKV